MRTDAGTALIAYDGSEDAAAAIRHVGRLLTPRPALVVHAWESLAGMLLHRRSWTQGTMREAAAQLDEEDPRHAERIAAEGAELARQAGFAAEPASAAGPPQGLARATGRS